MRSALALSVLPTLVLARRVRSNEPYDIQTAYARALSSRATTDPSVLSGATFDFIIAGGGVAGLAVAARLSEWDNVTVAVIEAGTDGSEFQDRIDMPGKSYLQGLTGTTFDWQYMTANEPRLGRAIEWPRGKGLGGSGAINGAFWCRGGKEEYDAWGTLQDGNNPENWGWDEMQKHIKKAETYTPMNDADAKTYSITHDSDAHGTDGPIQASYSRFQFPYLSTWVPTMMALGLPHLDPAAGAIRGVNFVPSTINPEGSKRSDSKAGYIAPIQATRKNLVILTGYQVTSVIWNSTAAGHAVAGGVTFAASAGTQSFTVNAAKEVILSGGVVGSTQILQLSGVGPKALLDSVGVESVVDLPGVGQNLQDHVATDIGFTSTANPTWALLADADVAAAETVKWQQDGSGMWSFLNEATAYASIADLFGTEAGAWATTVKNQLAASLSVARETSNMDATVAEGVKAQYAAQAEMISGDSGQVELIFNMLGGAVGDVGIQLALQRPFSRGKIEITSKDAFANPSIQPNYFSNNFDLDVMRAGMRYLRTIGRTSPMADSITGESRPGSTVTSDTDIDRFITGSSKTEYHPSSSNSMLPLNRGGVVNTSLVVYGTDNLRVIDASIMPMSIAAHLMATSYGIAEKGADIIKAAHMETIVPPTSPSKGSATGTRTGAGGAGQTGESDASTNGSEYSSMSMGAKIGIGAGLALVAGIIAAIIFFCLRSRKAKADQTARDIWHPSDTADPAGAYTGVAGHDGGSVPLAPFMHGQRDSFHSNAASFTSIDSYNHTQEVQYGGGNGFYVPEMGPTPGAQGAGYNAPNQPYRD